MLAAALLLSITPPASPACLPAATLRSKDVSAVRVPHVFQNGERQPLRLTWIDQQGKAVDLGTIAPGAYYSAQTLIGHVFRLTDEKGRCRRTVRIVDGFSGTYVGTSRYRVAAIHDGWRVFADQALDPAAEPARTALARLTGELEKVEAVLPPASLAQLRNVPIFLHQDSGPGAVYHPDADWLVKHGRTVEMLHGIELSNAQAFIETPETLLHELAHGHYARLSDADRAEIDAVYRRAMERGLYLRVKRWDGSIGPVYASANAAEYFAELSEIHFARNEYFPFTRADLAAYDPDGERMIASLWR